MAYIFDPRTGQIVTALLKLGMKESADALKHENVGESLEKEALSVCDAKSQWILKQLSAILPLTLDSSLQLGHWAGDLGSWCIITSKDLRSLKSTEILKQQRNYK